MRKSAIDVAIARVEEAIDRVRNEPRGRDSEEERAVGLLRELLQRAVETYSVLRAVVDGCLDREDADEREDDEARDVADETDPAAPLLGCGTPVDPFVLELLRDAAVEVPDADADRDECARTDEPLPGRPREDDCRRLVRLLVLRFPAARAGEDARGAVGKPEVDGGTTEVADALRPLVAVHRLQDAPERVRREAGREQHEDDLSEGVTGERVQCAVAARRVAADAERHADRKHADERIRDALGAEADTAEDLLPVALRARPDALYVVHWRDNARRPY